MFSQDGAILAQALTPPVPEKAATARLTAQRIPEKLLHVTRKLCSGLARNFEKLGPKYLQKKTETCPKLSLSYICCGLRD